MNIIENGHNNIIPESLIFKLQSSLKEEINIYNYAYLILDCPLIEIKTSHPQTQNEISIQFRIEGEIEGSVTCLIDTFKRSINIDSEKSKKSIFTESMNILVGNIFTALENNHHIYAICSSPVLNKNPIHSTRDLNLSMSYKLLIEAEEYDCRIIFNLEKNKIVEV